MSIQLGGLLILISRFGRIWILSPGFQAVFEPQPVKECDDFGFIEIYVDWGWPKFFWSTRG